MKEDVVFVKCKSMIGYALLSVLVVTCCQMCIDMVVVVMHEVIVRVVDMVMH